jgi:protein O-mannosyl-transferase
MNPISTRASVYEAQRTHDRSSLTYRLLALVLLAGTLGLIYYRVLNAPFVYDDEIAVVKNTSIRQLWPLSGSGENPGPLNPARELPTAGRPVVNLSFALNYRVHELNSSGYRLVNLAIHCISAYLLMCIVWRTLQLPRFNGQFDQAAFGLALVVALLWAAHPLQTEAIAYITQRTELLMAFFFLAMLNFAMQYWSATSLRTRGIWLALAVGASAAGMASKEVMVVAPLVVLLYEWTFLERSLGRIANQSWPLYAGLAATWLVLIALNINAPRSNSAGFNLGLSPFVWWGTQAKVLWMYLKLAVWPSPLSIHYELPYLDTWQSAAPWILLTTAFGIGSLYLLAKRRPAGFALAGMMLVLAPTSIVPILSEIAAERRMYLPLAGVISIAVVGAYTIMRVQSTSKTKANAARDWRQPRWVPMGIVVALVLVGCLSARRLSAYENTITLWKDVLVHQPNNYVATYNLASCFYARDRFNDALPYFETAVQLRPADRRARYSYGQTLARTGRFNDAISEFKTIRQTYPDYFPVYGSLADAYVRANRPAEAIETAENALTLARSANESGAVAQLEVWLDAMRAQQAAAERSSIDLNSKSR